MQSAHRVAKNTGILFAKMAITMFLSLYTTRLVLAALGTEDFGLFNLVGGVIAMLGFLNASMSSASQRFMSFAQGAGDVDKVKKIFNMSTLMHLCIALLVIIVFEIVGYFFFNGILNIAADRVVVAKMIYQFMVISTFFTIISVPYEAVITSHENMFFYAIEGILEALVKLAIALYITYNAHDHLLIYGLLMALLSVFLLILRRIYCHWKYEECQIKIRTFYDKGILKEMTSFGGWSLFGSTTSIITNYGQGILLNNFFGTTVNAAQGISNQISGQLEAFSSNMTKASNPIIVKSEGAQRRDKMLEISLTSNKISFILLAVFAIPFIIEIDYILNIWLKDVPKYAVIFTILLLVRRLVAQLTSTLHVSIDASGKNKGKQVAGGILSFFPLIIAYFFFNAGFSAVYLYLIFIGIELIRSFGHTLYFAKKHCDLNVPKFITESVIPSVFVTVLSLLIGWIPFYIMEIGVIRFLLVCFLTSSAFLLLSYFIIFNKIEKDLIIRLLLKFKSFIIKDIK